MHEIGISGMCPFVNLVEEEIEKFVSNGKSINFVLQ